MTTHAITLGRRSRAAVALVTLVGLAAFVWPLVAAPRSAAIAHAGDAPILFAVLVPLLLVVVLAQLADGDMDAKSIAMLGVLAAVISALRPLGGGVAGIEPIWAVLILGGRALGPGFGFSLGAVSMFSSALVTGGVGPWLPFQMIAAAWVGLGAGLLPGLRGRRELVMLAAYAALACLAYGFLLNLWLWPFTSGLPAQVAFIPEAAQMEHLVAWVRFSLITSLGFDLPRAALTVIAILVAGRPILTALRRVGRKAAFGAQPTFEPAQAHVTLDHVPGRMAT
jgi:energy-coupling factor transport system substrate-specific component